MFFFTLVVPPTHLVQNFVCDPGTIEAPHASFVKVLEQAGVLEVKGGWVRVFQGQPREGQIDFDAVEFHFDDGYEGFWDRSKVLHLRTLTQDSHEGVEVVVPGKVLY